MRLVTYSHAGSGSRLGVEAASGTIHDLTSVLGVADVGEMLARGIAAADVEDLRARAKTLEPDEVVIQAPIRRPGKIICVGLNYHDHCREQGVEPPEYPILFSKFANAVTHPGASGHAAGGDRAARSRVRAGRGDRATGITSESL